MEKYVCPNCGKEFTEKPVEKCPYCLCPTEDFTTSEIYCPDCGKKWEDKAPEVCDVCGCPSKYFVVNKIIHTTKSKEEILNEKNLDYDTSSLRKFGVVFWVLSIVASVLFFVGAFVMFSNPQMRIYGWWYILAGVCLLVNGWFLNAFITLCTNMSDRLSRMEYKLK